MSDTIYGGPYEWIHLESDLETSRTQENYSSSSSSDDERYSYNFDEAYLSTGDSANHYYTYRSNYRIPQSLAGLISEVYSKRLTVSLLGPKTYTRSDSDSGNSINYFAFMLHVDASIQSYSYYDEYLLNRCVWRVNIDSYDEIIKTIICNEERIIAYVIDKLSNSSVRLSIFTINDNNDEINNYLCSMCPCYGQYKQYAAYINYNIIPCVDSIPAGVDNINILLGGSAVETDPITGDFEVFQTFTIPSLINPGYLNRILGILEPTTTTTTTTNPQ